MDNNELKPLYLFDFDDKTGVITKHEISDYETHGDSNGFRGRLFVFKSDTRSRKRRRCSAYENDFERVFHSKLYTYNPSYEDAYKLFEEWMAGRKKVACEQAERISELYENMHKNNNF